MKTSSAETRRELEVVLAVALGVQASIKSSIADWGDVIGDEIATINKIGRIKSEQEQLLESPGQADETAPPATDLRPVAEQLARNNAQIAALLQKLPASLRLVAESQQPSPDAVDAAMQHLLTEYRQSGHVSLRGFWDPSLERDIRTFKPGDRLTIRMTDVGSRSLAVCAFDQQGKTVGIITNTLGSKYYVFREAVASFLRRSQFEAEITEIDAKDVGNRHYFQARVVPEKEPEPIWHGSASTPPPRARKG